MPESFETYVRRFTDFYVSLTEVYPDEFAPGGPPADRIHPSRFPVRGGWTRSTFYMRHVLELIFPDPAVIGDLITLARYAFRASLPQRMPLNG